MLSGLSDFVIREGLWLHPLVSRGFIFGSHLQNPLRPCNVCTQTETPSGSIRDGVFDFSAIIRSHSSFRIRGLLSHFAEFRMAQLVRV